MNIKKHLNLKTAVAAFMVLLLILIFFSKTIYTFNMVTVSAAMPQNGSISKFETATGIIFRAHQEEIYSQVSAAVENILVKEGDFVVEGEELIRLSFDTKDARQKIDEYEINKKKLLADVQNINIKIDKTNKSISDTKNEERREISKAQNDYESLKTLYDEGAAAKKDLDSAYNDLQNLIDKYEKQLSDYLYEIEALKQDLTAKSLDLSSLDIQMGSYIDADGGISAVCAPKSGVVESVSVKKGQRVSDGQLIAVIGIGSEFEIECEISLENNFVITGDVCKMSNSERSLEGIVTAVSPNESAKIVTISVQDEQVTSGETFTVRFEKETQKKQVLVPNGAVNKDNDGYFVYQIKRRDGILGKEYFVQKLRVYIGDSDSDNTAIIKGIGFFEPIVEFSDKPFEEGETIKLKNEGDFFEE